MRTLTVRELDDATYDGLKRVAVSRGRSMEAEARAILTRAVASAGWWDAWVSATAQARGGELPTAPRSQPRVQAL
ncbi:MAG: hypothetical protein LBR19_01945 [Bifidobacteriaceae bacterium]|jgi:plasmid stability protein|nr:hypothetical protein [Bifidobacteriaceae bacterium]